MAEHKVTLNINSTDEDASCNTMLAFNSLEELSRMLSLAGIQTSEVSNPENELDIPQDDIDDGSFEVDVGSDGSISMPTDENADYDYGRNPTSRKGYVYDIDPYTYQGDASDITRTVPARSGDNPLRRVGESKMFEHYLKEVEKKARKKRK